MAYLIHVANVLYLLSYLVRDILWLRVLTIVAGTTLLPFYYAQHPPLIAAIAWNVLFLSINAYHIQRLLLERRPVQLEPLEQELHRTVFSTLTSREFKQLVSVGAWKKLGPASQLIEQGTVLDALALIARGQLEVRVDDAVVATLDAGRLVGEMSYLTGEKTSASVWAVEECVVLSWAREKLETFMRDHPQQRLALQRVIGTDLVAKLRRQSPSIRRNEPRASGVEASDAATGAVQS